MTPDAAAADAPAVPKEPKPIMLDHVAAHFQRRLQASESEGLLMASALREQEDVIRRLSAVAEQFKAIASEQKSEIATLKAEIETLKAAAGAAKPKK